MKIIIFIFISFVFSQSEQPYPPLDLVSVPTAGTLPRGSYTYETYLSKNGAVMPRLAIGLTESLTFGVSHGIHNLIGDDKPIYNPQPGFQIKYRIFDESQSFPAMVIGLDTQGKGKFSESDIDNDIARYERKAVGFYLITSKNWNVLGNMGFHFGLSKNLWEKSGDPEDDGDVNLYFGVDKEINRSFSLIVEFDAGLNDNEDEYNVSDLSAGKGKGFLNAGIRWAVSRNLMVEINFNDIRKNTDAEYTNRELKVMYSASF
tara:strand:- start:445 stop:1224 length:780 start_codon:yes stop_codon:yes gene_type:complete